MVRADDQQNVRHYVVLSVRKHNLHILEDISVN